MTSSIINKYNLLDEFDKTRIYMKYVVTCLMCKYQGSMNIYIKSFEEYTSLDNIKVTDMGEDWEKYGFAQRFRTEYYGIMEYLYHN